LPGTSGAKNEWVATAYLGNVFSTPIPSAVPLRFIGGTIAWDNAQYRGTVTVPGVYAFAASMEIKSSRAGNFIATVFIDVPSMPYYTKQALSLSNVQGGDTREASLTAIGEVAAGAHIQVRWQSRIGDGITEHPNPPGSLLRCNFNMYLLYETM
jgi:hypothetical protein